MIKSIYKSCLLLVAIVILTIGCKKDQSLEHFMVSQLESEDVHTYDISKDILNLDVNFNSEENQEIISTIKKANIMAFKLTETNKDLYTKKLETLRKILSQEKYSPLMRFGSGAKGVRLYSLGDEDKIDEFILLGNDNKEGWLIIRILGNKMEPEKLISLTNKLDIDFENLSFNDLNFQ